MKFIQIALIVAAVCLAQVCAQRTNTIPENCNRGSFNRNCYRSPTS
ncbi:hypothetical protein PPTG_24221 [Phytophthora nicotianae INRA-310]|uniref:Uncharacterized protein n=3 Tax=Phytophthora nicotianae TaxID=4792 RepID=W2PI65_PHYN3|nr:hypothetical protein PPTG_24221 [Phytophthora nicotianae INRA-310]ETM33601.1 hypothetical protein L914_19189 [Phytophthora nicotianae]ETN00708.1 hypothetical protein PPTG_24221 [Phytophthora nicotianae INRA-310]ETO62114.1 hypothetical protein F444_19962 [Phytophthora nicotianae P1976]